MSKGLVGSWLFNEGGGDLVYDTSGNGNHGPLEGDTYFVAGRDGPALDFDGVGDDAVLIPISTSFIDSYPFTFVVWSKQRVLSGSQAIIGLVNSAINNSYLVLEWRDFSSSRRLQWNLRNSTTNLVRRTTASYDDDWHQIIVVFHSGNDSDMFADGIFVVNNADNVPGAFDYDTISLGVIGDSSPGDRFDGQIGSALIYNRALSAGEITSLYLDPYQMFKRNL